MPTGLMAYRAIHSLIALLLVTLLVPACTQLEFQRLGVGDYYYMAHKLDELEEFVDEYGTVSTSEPLLLENKGQFALDYQRPTKEYVDAARSAVHGSALVATQEARDVQRAVKTDIDIEKAAAAAAAAYASGGGAAGLVAASKALNAASGEGPTTDAAVEAGEVKQTEPAFESALPLDRPAKAVLSSDKFRAPLEIGPLPTGISERQALLIGVNDKITENVLKYFANPGVGVLENKRIYLAVLQVSVQPGWRTKTGYVGEVNVRTAYASSRANVANANSRGCTISSTSPLPWISSLSDPNLQQPFAFSVFPSIEAQTLDLRQSQRSQVAEASFWAQVLRSTGATVQAESLDDYVKRVERDFASRNPVPLITAYSNGASFGYQIKPSFHALANPGSDDDAAGHVLQPASFPAVVVIVADKEEVKCWDAVEWLVSSRWIPADKPWFGGKATESERLIAARELDLLLQAHRYAYGEDPGPYKAPDSYASSNLGQEIRRRYNLYASLAQGITRYSPLPPPPKEKPKETPPLPAITAVTPTIGWQNAPTVLAISGSGFSFNNQSIVKQVTVGAIAAEYFVAGEKTIVAVVPAGAFHEAPDGAEVVVVTTTGVGKAAQQVHFERHSTPAPDLANATITLVRDASGKVTSIVLDGNLHLPPRELLQAIRGILEKEGTAGKVTVKLPSGGSLDVGSSTVD